MYAMRPLRNFKTNQCCHLIVAADTREAFGGARRSRAESRRPSRIANRAFFLNEEEKTRFVERVWRVATFMKTFKQTATMSYNGRRVHPGTIWESRFRAKTCGPDEKAELMNMAGYIDRNPVKAKMVCWPDEYEWCSFAAAARGDARCVDGYRFIYSVFAPLTWERIREMHEKSIHLVLKELEDERLAGRAKKGLSVDDSLKRDCPL